MGLRHLHRSYAFEIFFYLFFVSEVLKGENIKIKILRDKEVVLSNYLKLFFKSILKIVLNYSMI